LNVTADAIFTKSLDIFEILMYNNKRILNYETDEIKILNPLDFITEWSDNNDE
jgi:hypothetical protein